MTPKFERRRCADSISKVGNRKRKVGKIVWKQNYWWMKFERRKNRWMKSFNFLKFEWKRTNMNEEDARWIIMILTEIWNHWSLLHFYVLQKNSNAQLTKKSKPTRTKILCYNLQEIISNFKFIINSNCFRFNNFILKFAKTVPAFVFRELSKMTCIYF